MNLSPHSSCPQGIVLCKHLLSPALAVCTQQSFGLPDRITYNSTPAPQCDDANDLGLAAVVGHVYVVGITHPSVKEAADAAPEKFSIANAGSILATEEMLAAVSMELGSFQLG